MLGLNRTKIVDTDKLGHSCEGTGQTNQSEQEETDNTQFLGRAGVKAHDPVDRQDQNPDIQNNI